jgi:hypothetical protein
MSGLETLPPDQRAVLQLILQQGRGYADLAGLLKIDVRAVRDRALAGVRALGDDSGARLAPELRERIADYVLGQQDDAERLVTLAALGESATAAQWARGVQTRLAPIATAPLPEVPPAPTTNGAAPALPAASPAPPSPAPTPPLQSAATPAPPTAPPPPGATAAQPPPALPPLPQGGADRGADDDRPRPSRLGGAILLGAIGALLVAVLLFVLLSGGDGKGSEKSAGGGTTQSAATRTQPKTTPPAATTTQPAAQVAGQANLTSPTGGQALGIGIVQQSGSDAVLAVEAQKLAANGGQDIYAVWLQGPPGAKFLGYVPQKVGANGAFTVSAPLPRNFKSYKTVLVARESTAAKTAPAQPGTTILSGTLQLR